MLKLMSWLVLWVVVALPVRAETSGEVQRLSQALGLPEILLIMQDKGVSYGDELADSFFPGQGDRLWKTLVLDIYDIDEMGEAALGEIALALDAGQIAAVTGFYESQLGAEVVALEIAARRALQDEAIDDANIVKLARMIATEHPRIPMLRKFIEVNKLLETNVIGALNSNYAFYTGLSEGGGFQDPMSDEQIISDVWEQAPEIRLDTGKWLYGYLSMAFSPLSDKEMNAYIEFSETAAAQALNSALFSWLDQMFEGISHDLGLAAAKIMTGEEL